MWQDNLTDTEVGAVASLGALLLILFRFSSFSFFVSFFSPARLAAPAYGAYPAYGAPPPAVAMIQQHALAMDAVRSLFVFCLVVAFEPSERDSSRDSFR